jgi:uncharacterized membrane protein
MGLNRTNKKNFNISVISILVLVFISFFLNTLVISENTTLILDFVNLGIVCFILFFLFLNSNINYIFIDVPTNYNAIRMLWTTNLIGKITNGNLL